MIMESVGLEADEHFPTRGSQSDLGHTASSEPVTRVETQAASAAAIEHLHDVGLVHFEAIKLEGQRTSSRVANSIQALLVARVVGEAVCRRRDCPVAGVDGRFATLGVLDFESPPRVAETGFHVQVQLVARRHEQFGVLVGVAGQASESLAFRRVSVADKDVVAVSFHIEIFDLEKKRANISSAIHQSSLFKIHFQAFL